MYYIITNTKEKRTEIDRCLLFTERCWVESRISTEGLQWFYHLKCFEKKSECFDIWIYCDFAIWINEDNVFDFG